MAEKNKTGRSGLRVFSGGQDPTARIGSVSVVVAPEHKPPFPVQARVLEEDTFLVMSARPTVCEPEEDPIRLMTRLIETRPEVPGSVRISGRRPYRILAIVHDVNQDPTWRESWVSEALEGALRASEERGIEALSLEMLGCVHGRLDPLRFTTLLIRTIRRIDPGRIQRIWLVSPRGVREADVARRLRAAP
ncbi:MAG: hypothetical protein PVG49_05780 [Desulfobacteraceae bacterium]|jgi:hypothetical protein